MANLDDVRHANETTAPSFSWPLTPPTCAECGRPWFDASERWRSMLAVGDDDRADPWEAILYCPSCAQREFGAM